MLSKVCYSKTGIPSESPCLRPLLSAAGILRVLNDWLPCTPTKEQAICDMSTLLVIFTVFCLTVKSGAPNTETYHTIHKARFTLSSKCVTDIIIFAS